MNDFIDFIQSITAKIPIKNIAILGEEWIANGISLVMGVLGTIAFFMQVPRKIKPIVIQYGNIIFQIEEKNSINNNKHWVTLNAIELFLSISNLKNAVGIIEDIFVRVYTTDSYNPETVIYYVTKKTIDGMEDNFTPFILSPNSHISMKLVFGQVEQRHSEKIISLDNNYTIDVFYKIKGTKKPFSLKSIRTFNNGEIIDNKLELKNSNMNIERDKYYNKLEKLNISTYQGITNYYFIHFFYKIKCYIFYFPRRYFIGFFEALIFISKYAITNIISFFISKKIIIKGGKNVKQPKLIVGNKENRLLTDKTMVNISKIIEKTIKIINVGVTNENKISFSLQGKNIVLEKFGKDVHIYTPGDSSIYAQVLNNENTINIHYEIKESRWGIKYWTYKNKFITPYNMAINILNYFILYTLVRR